MGKTHSIHKERYVSFTPSLAKQIGVEGAIVVQTFTWLINDTDSGKMINGHKWVWNSIARWQEKFFPFWPQRTLRRIFKALETMGVLMLCNPDGGSGINYYRINEGYFETLTLENADSIDIEDESNRGHSGRDIASTLAAPYITEPTTEPTKGCGTSVPHARSGFKKGPKYPYPTSQEEMYKILEESGIEPNPEREGHFYDQMATSGWTINGEKVWDWKATYEARVQNSEESCKRK
jgi:hypothetical protein